MVAIAGRPRAAARAALLALALAACAAPAAGPGATPRIPPSELHARLGSAAPPLVLDVRTPEEFAAGHVPSAQNIPYDEIPERIAEIDASREVAIYCRRGPRALKGEASLRAAGIEDVVQLEGGFSAWQASGLPVAHPE